MGTQNKYKDVTFGLAEAVFNKLGGMEGVQRFLRGDIEVVIKVHTINTDDDPYLPEDWEVVEHQKGGEFRWNAEAIGLHLDEAQQGVSIKGEELRKKLNGKPVLNANVLDYLLKNPQLIPDEWKGERVFFWGTIYSDSGGTLVVRCLELFGGSWRWNYDWLNCPFYGRNPAAVLHK